MSETGDIYRQLREQAAAKRERNKERSTAILTEHGIAFDSRNNGLQLILRTPAGRVDFYPSTGLYKGIVSGRGVFNLLREIEQQGI